MTAAGWMPDAGAGRGSKSAGQARIGHVRVCCHQAMCRAVGGVLRPENNGARAGLRQLLAVGGIRQKGHIASGRPRSSVPTPSIRGFAITCQVETKPGAEL